MYPGDDNRRWSLLIIVYDIKKPCKQNKLWDCHKTDNDITK